MDVTQTQETILTDQALTPSRGETPGNGVDLKALFDAFYSTIEDQARMRGKEDVTPFGQKVAEVIIDAGLAALQDHLTGTQC